MGLGLSPSVSSLPQLPTFSTASNGLALLAAAATQPLASPHGASEASSPAPLTPHRTVAIPPKLVKRIHDLEFIEMNELLLEAWGVETAQQCCQGSLLLSSKHWPVVFAVDMACDVAAHLEVRHPKLATAPWQAGECALRSLIREMIHRFVVHNYVHDSGSCIVIAVYFFQQVVQHQEFAAALDISTSIVQRREDATRDHTYSHSMVHPLTTSVERYIVGDQFMKGRRHLVTKSQPSPFTPSPSVRHPRMGGVLQYPGGSSGT